MPTVIAHPAAAIGLFPWFRRHLGAPVVLFAGAFLTVAPDLDVIAFRFGIPYEHMFGHRGISHSLAAAFFTSGMLAAAIARWRRRHFGLLWAYFFLCMASHGPLDMLTSGGRGIAVFAPFSNERYFFDVRPIAVSAIGVGDFPEQTLDARADKRDALGLAAVPGRRSPRNSSHPAAWPPAATAPAPGRRAGGRLARVAVML